MSSEISGNISWAELDGSISSVDGIKCIISPIGQLSGSVSKNIEEVPVYHGDYEVIPDANNDQILYTSNKILKDDITVKKVPYFETHNESGTTVYIAMEV